MSKPPRRPPPARRQGWRGGRGRCAPPSSSARMQTGSARWWHAGRRWRQQSRMPHGASSVRWNSLWPAPHGDISRIVPARVAASAWFRMVRVRYSAQHAAAPGPLGRPPHLRHFTHFGEVEGRRRGHRAGARSRPVPGLQAAGRLRDHGTWLAANSAAMWYWRRREPGSMVRQ